MNQEIADIIKQLNDNTNTVSAKLDKLIAEIADNVTVDQVAALQAVSDHLKALGADPAAPIPPAA